MRQRLSSTFGNRREEQTANALNSVPGGIIGGVALAIIVLVIVPGSSFNELSLTRWLHILSGVMWVGLFFYVVVAQIPALGAAAADKGGPGGAGITKYVAPRVLLWWHRDAVQRLGSDLDESEEDPKQRARGGTRLMRPQSR